MVSDDRKLLHVRLGPLEVDVPQTVGYFGGIGAALALGLLEPPLAAFIAAIPVVKMLADPGSPIPVRFVAEIVQGAAKPVGSDADGTVRRAADRASHDTQQAERAVRSRRPRAVKATS
jgi:hypothetical protein